jgi:hypothetical protein
MKLPCLDNGYIYSDGLRNIFFLHCMVGEIVRQSYLEPHDDRLFVILDM